MRKDQPTICRVKQGIPRWLVSHREVVRDGGFGAALLKRMLARYRPSVLKNLEVTFPRFSGNLVKPSATCIYDPGLEHLWINTQLLRHLGAAQAVFRHENVRTATL